MAYGFNDDKTKYSLSGIQGDISELQSTTLKKQSKTVSSNGGTGRLGFTGNIGGVVVFTSITNPNKGMYIVNNYSNTNAVTAQAVIAPSSPNISIDVSNTRTFIVKNDSNTALIATFIQTGGSGSAEWLA